MFFAYLKLLFRKFRISEFTGNEYKDFIARMLPYPGVSRKSSPSYIFLTTEKLTNVTMTTADTYTQEVPPPINQVLTFNSTMTITYPVFFGRTTYHALRIRSTEHISASALINQDISTIIPTEKLTTSYLISFPKFR